jgi:hypothetical protein
VDHWLGPRLLRDIRKGIAAKRLTIADPLMSFVSVPGTTLGAISIGLQAGSLQGQMISKRVRFPRVALLPNLRRDETKEATSAPQGDKP